MARPQAEGWSGGLGEKPVKTSLRGAENACGHWRRVCL